VPAVELRFRAYPSVLVDDRAAALTLKRGLALIAVLSELDRKVARAQLIGLLWPDAAAEVARGRLRRLAHDTNRALGIDLVVGDGDALWLAGPVSSDVGRMRSLAMRIVKGAPGASEALEPLLSTDAHQILEGFGFGADTFDAWLDERRSEQHRLVVRALVRAGEHWIASREPGLAAEAAARLIALEPLADPGHELRVRAHALRGDLAAMEAAYFSFAELLRSEVGARPSPAYEAAYEAARRVATGMGDFLQAGEVRSPPIRFADTADGAVAYLELGRGPQTLLILFGLWSHVEVAWDEPTIRGVLQRLAKRHRVVLMDRRGTGLSERLALAQSVPSGVEDLDAVRRALGVARVWLFGNAAGGMIAIEYAVTHADAVAGLVLYAPNARGTAAPGYPWAPTAEQLETWIAKLQSSWGGATSLAEFAPSQAHDPRARDWWARLLRQAMSRNSLPVLLREFGRMDVRHRLAHVRAPTLVLQRDGDRIVRSGAARYVAHAIAGAELRLLPGDDHNMWAGDAAAVIDEVERFIDARASA
jgi:pimeloyl-ACP methyl ester carboxylesterase/DNA-binding SARP family transcriptional activator